LGLVAGIFFTRSVRLLYMEDSTNDLTQDHRMGMMIPSAFKEHSQQETQKKLDTNEKVDSMEKYNGSLSRVDATDKTEISYRNDTMRNTTTKKLSKTTKVESKANATSEFLNSSSHKQREYRHYDVPWGTIREQFDSGTNLTAGQDYLDFAVVGFPKCGTSTMMHWLNAHPEIKVFPFEIRALQKNHPAFIVKRIIKGLPEGPYLRGYKSPTDVEDQRAINKLDEHYPKTKLFVGLRHPVKWFESFYNYRIQNGLDLPPAQELEFIRTSSRGVSIERANFHSSLVRFGKTPLDETEMEFFSYDKNVLRDMTEHRPTKKANPIFLYDTDQLGDKNGTRSLQLREDIQAFLNLNESMPSVLHYSPGHKVNETEQIKIDSKKIHICEQNYAEHRQKLLVVGERVARWVEDYFLKSSDVVLSDREHFLEILSSYSKDPCLQNGTMAS